MGKVKLKKDINPLRSKLGRVADILYPIVLGLFVMGELSLIVGYFGSSVTFDQFLLYSISIYVAKEILYKNQDDRKKENAPEEGRGKK